MRNTRAGFDENANERYLETRALTGQGSIPTASPASPTAAIAQRWCPFEEHGDDVTCAELTLGALPPRVWQARRTVLPIACYWSRGVDGRRRIAFAGAWRHPIGTEGERNVGFMRACWSTRLLLIGPTLMESLGLSMRGAMPPADLPALSVVDEHRHGTAFHSLFELLRCGGSREAERATAAATIVRLVEEHRRRAAAAPSSDARIADRVERAREFLITRTADRVELDDLAVVSSVSKFHLLRVFEREMGMTPRTFQRQLRLMCALAMIAVGESLSRATFDAGFADQSHLTRRFKENLGLTPGVLQRLLAAEGEAAANEATTIRMPIAAAIAGLPQVARAIQGRSAPHEALDARVA